MNWVAFWSGLLGTTLPGLAVSALMLYLSGRMNKSLERNKKELEQSMVKFSKLHDKRLEAMVLVYNAFCDYLDFLRRALYSPGRRQGLNLDPMHEFRNTIERQIVFLDDATAQKVRQYQGELLEFWNWTMQKRSQEGEAAWDQVQHKLDMEIPTYLVKLRQDINRVVDPHHGGHQEPVVLASL